jgi:hypothetical protein
MVTKGCLRQILEVAHAIMVIAPEIEQESLVASVADRLHVRHEIVSEALRAAQSHTTGETE